MKKVSYVVIFAIFLLCITSIDSFSQGVWRFYTVNDGLPSNEIRDFAFTPDGKMWVAFSDNGVGCYDSQTWKFYSAEDGLAHNGVSSISADSSGVLWVGTWGGISRFDGLNWTSYNAQNGLAFNVVLNVCNAPDGKAWCSTMMKKGGTPYSSISCFDGNEWISYIPPDSLIGGFSQITSMAIDNNGVVWMGTGFGLRSFDGKEWKRYHVEDGLHSEMITNLELSNDGNIFVLSNGGINIIKNSKITDFPFVVPTGLDFYNIYANSDTDFWILYYLGVVHFSDNKWVYYENPDIDIVYVSSITVDKDGIVWIGTNEGQGLLSLDPYSVSVESEKTPESFKLLQNYPNPFNSSTTFEYYLPHSKYINLSVYNIAGQKVATLVNGNMSLGNHIVSFNGSNLASGGYFYRFEAGKFNKTGKMLLVK